MFVNTDEEIGSRDSSRFVQMLARGAARAFVLESGEGADGRLKIARKGLGRFTVTVRGRPSHAGADFEHGISAILELSHQVQRLFALNDPARGITVNVGTIDGGLRPNVIAPEATAIVDVRVPTAAAARRLEAALRGLTPVLEGATVEVDGGWSRPPMEALPRNRTLLATAMRLGHDLGISLEDAGLVGGGSDANTTSLYTATLDGLGPVGEGSHATDERVDTRQMPERAALLALLLLEPDVRQRPACAGTAARRAGVRRAAATRVAVLGTDASSTNGTLTRAWCSLGIDAALVGPDELEEWLHEGDTVLGRLDILPTLDGVEAGLLELLFARAARGPRAQPCLDARHGARQAPHGAGARARRGAASAHRASASSGRRPRPRAAGRDQARLGSWGVDVFRCETRGRARARPRGRARAALVPALRRPRPGADSAGGLRPPSRRRRRPASSAQCGAWPLRGSGGRT